MDWTDEEVEQERNDARAKVAELETAESAAQLNALAWKTDLDAARAEVERLKVSAGELQHQRDMRGEALEFARAEVERLKADLARLGVTGEALHAEAEGLEQRATSAESRLAAIRTCLLEHDTEEGPDFVETVNGVRRVLEGDAPQEAQGHDIYMCHVENCLDCERAIAAEIEAKGPAVVAVGLAAAAGLPVRIGPQGAKPKEKCLCDMTGGAELCMASRHPCSDTCTHDDAATAGHPERVKERSEAVKEVVDMASVDPVAALAKAAGAKTGREVASYRCGYDAGAEAMRTAILADVREWFQSCYGEVPKSLLLAIEGAAP